MDLCALSDKVKWELMPWQWDGAPLEWIQAITMYIKARDAARQPEQRMTQDQLAVAPNALSKQEAEAHLREIGWLK